MMNRKLLTFEKENDDIITMSRFERSAKSYGSRKQFSFWAEELKTESELVTKDDCNYAELSSQGGALHVEICWLNRSDNKIFDGVVEHFDLPHQKLLDFLESDQTEWQCLSLPKKKPTKFIFINQSTIARLRRQNKVIYNKLFKFLWQNFLECEVTLRDAYLPWSFNIDCISSYGFENGDVILHNYDEQGNSAEAFYSIE